MKRICLLFALLLVFSAVGSGASPIRELYQSLPTYVGTQRGASTQLAWTSCRMSISDDFLALTADLNLGLLRFPGGGANYLVYQAAQNRLYDVRDGSTIDLGEVVRVLTQLDTSVLLTANPWTGTKEEAVSLLTYLIDQGVKVVGVELGNEAYSTTLWGSDPAAYVSVATQFAAAIRAVHPTMPLAAVAAPYTATRKTPHNMVTPVWPPFRAFNRTVGAAGFYDAVVLHTYPGVNSCDSLPTIEDRIQCVNESFRNYYDQDFPLLLSLIQSYHGPGTDIWITEWNMNEGQDYCNTMAHAFHVTRVLMKLAELNSNGGPLTGHLRFVTHQKLGVCSNVANGRQSSLIAGKRSDEMNIDPENDYLRLTPYYPFLFLVGMDGKGFSYNRAVTSIVTYPSTQIDYWTFMDGEKAYLLILNDTGSDLLIQNVSMAETDVTNRMMRYQVLSGETLYSSRGYRLGLTPYDLATYSDLTTGISAIPRYGVGLITIQLPD